MKMKRGFELEIQKRKKENVLYINSNQTGASVIRICGLPLDLDEIQLDIAVHEKKVIGYVCKGGEK